MWPYTGEENRWLGRAEQGSAANITAVPAPVATKTGRAQPGWFRALDRLIKTPDNDAGENVLPLVAARLKDPLNAIRDSARALRGNPSLSPDQQAHYLDVVLQEHEHLAEMISAMLDQAYRPERSKHA
jgi:signal transduction histidine kinase